MKRLLGVCTLLAATAFLLIQCANSITATNPNKPQSENKMKRFKTKNGVEYEVLREGSGASPSAGQKVTVHYVGWLSEEGEQGQKIDSSYDRGQPFEFFLGMRQVIKGWDEGVETMKVGEKRRLYIPSQLGYGANGVGKIIPANADLIFEVELLDIGNTPIEQKTSK